MRLRRFAPRLLGLSIASLAVTDASFAATSVTGPKAGARAAAPPAEKGAALPPGHPAVGADQETGALPPGHPAIGPTEANEDDEDLPPGHPAPATGARAPSAQDRLPEDASDVDAQLPAGSIVVEVRDGSDRPMPHADVTLGILQQSVAKGESRRRTAKQADDSGTARFDGLEFGAGVAYRVTVPWGAGQSSEPATYAASPFQLDLHHGQRVKIHVYPVTSRISDAMVGMDGIVYMELRDDVVQFDELFRVYNLGKVTWVPSDVVLGLPPGYKAFTAQKEMSDTGFDDASPRGAKMRGTYSPGQHETQFRYQVPYSGGESIEFSLSLPPHVARLRVMAEASKGMTLHVTDLPEAVSERNQGGQRILLTERQLRAGEQPLSRLRIVLDNIPTEGSAKWVATAIAAATMAFGLYAAFEQEKHRTKTERRTDDQEAERARKRLVTEIAALDQARQAGEVGPKAYDRIRAVLIDALARLMAPGKA